jgi:hypothetical protein
MAEGIQKLVGGGVRSDHTDDLGRDVANFGSAGMWGGMVEFNVTDEAVAMVRRWTGVLAEL